MIGTEGAFFNASRKRDFRDIGTVCLPCKALTHDGFFKAFVDGEVVRTFGDTPPKLDVDTSDYITIRLVDEYLNEYKGNI